MAVLVEIRDVVPEVMKTSDQLEEIFDKVIRVSPACALGITCRDVVVSFQEEVAPLLENGFQNPGFRI